MSRSGGLCRYTHSQMHGLFARWPLKSFFGLRKWLRYDASQRRGKTAVVPADGNAWVLFFGFNSGNNRFRESYRGFSKKTGWWLPTLHGGLLAFAVRP